MLEKWVSKSYLILLFSGTSSYFFLLFDKNSYFFLLFWCVLLLDALDMGPEIPYPTPAPWKGHGTRDTVLPPPWTNRCLWNITFPQLLFRVVKIVFHGKQNAFHVHPHEVIIFKCKEFDCTIYHLKNFIAEVMLFEFSLIYRVINIFHHW